MRASYWRDQSSWNATVNVNVLLLGPGWLRGLHVPRPRPAPRLGSGRELVRAEDAVAGGDEDVVQPRALQPPAERGAVGHPGHIIAYQLHCTISRITNFFIERQDQHSYSRSTRIEPHLLGPLPGWLIAGNILKKDYQKNIYYWWIILGSVWMFLITSIFH